MKATVSPSEQITLHLGMGVAVYTHIGICASCKLPLYKRTSMVGDDGRVGTALAVEYPDGTILCQSCAHARGMP
jgi:hypothetical protein